MKEMDDRINKLVKKWLESLEETKRAQAEVLDAYFLFRRPLPEDDPGYLAGRQRQMGRMAVRGYHWACVTV